MQQIILVIHLLLALGIVGAVLLQRSEGGGLGIGGGGGAGGGGLMDTRSTANFLTRATAVLAGLFFITSITLAVLAGGSNGPGRSLVLDGGAVDSAPVGQHSDAPAATEEAGEETEPAQPAVPTD